ncbi:unnamed protein product [Schistosoma turkestanicum]|nr:unnamed protein product [Schistosoma turkestanicum]
MWQEARKQEKHIKTLMVDYKRRAERRRDYYERIKQDPIKFLRLFGRSSKLHLDSEVTKAAENPNNMMPWIGDPSIMIDRFDVRASLEHYDTRAADDIKLTSTERIESRLCNYERYRCLIHNEYASVTEAMALKQIEMDEKYGDLEKRRKEEEEVAVKKTQEPKAAIGFVYDDSTCFSESSTTNTQPSAPQNDSDSDDEADSDMDIDVELDVSTLTTEARRQLAKSAATYGLHPSDFVRLLDADQQLETELRLAKALEEEKLQLSGRRSRRSRRLLRERRAQEKFPRLLTTKIGLLNGQPISRRTVYLSASSSDSGDYPSDVEDQDFSGIVYGSPTSKAATIRAQRARAKPILSNARGPAVLIGGMTSISLCRRNNKQSGRSFGSKHRSTPGRSSSSSGGSVRGHRSSSSDRSYSNRRSRGGFRRPKHSRVEYITTFGDDEDNFDDKRNNGGSSRFGSNKQTGLFDRSGGGLSGPFDSKPPGSAASAVAASVVSKLLSSGSQSSTVKGRSSFVNSSSPKSIKTESRVRSPPSFSDRRKPLHPRSRYRRSTSQSRSSSRRSQSSRGSRSRRRYHSRTRNSSSSRSRRGSYRRYRRSPDRYRSRRRSSSSRRSRSDSSTSTDNRKSNYDRVSTNPSTRSFNQNVLHESNTVVQSNAQKQPSPPIRKRYYRPELESADELELSDEEQNNSKKESSKSSDGNSGKPSRKSDSNSYGNFAGKMTSQQLVTNGPSSSHDLKTPGIGGGVGGGSTVRPLMPQELLKRRVQSQLTKAFNADKKAELEKQIQLERERQAREEGLRRQARLLRRQEEKRLRAERRAMAIQLGSVLGNSSDDSSSHSSSSSGSRHHSSSRFRSRRFQGSPVRRQSSMYSSSSRKYSPPPTHSTRNRPRIESERGLLGSPSRTTDGRLPSPPSNSNSSNCPRDTRGSTDRIPRSNNSLLGSPMQNSYSASKDRGTASSSSRFIGSREEQRRYNSTRPYTSSSRGAFTKRSD